MTKREEKNVREIVDALTAPNHTSQCTHLFLLEIKPHDGISCQCPCHIKKGSLFEPSKESKLLKHYTAKKYTKRAPI